MPRTAPKLDGRQTFAWPLAAEIEMAPPQWGRPLRKGDVRNIAAAFDPDKFGAVFVWYRPDLLVGHGRYVTIDGQHRLAAIRLMGYDDQRVPAILYEGLTMESAADLSIGLQDRRNLHALDKHRAELASHDRRAIDIDKLTRTLDLQLVYATSGSSRRITAVSELGRIWEVMGAPGLERVLRVCDAAWEGTSAGFSAQVMKLVALLIAAHNGEMDDPYLATVLGARSPAQWVQRDQSPRRPLGSIAQDVIIEYNKHRRGAGRLPELTPSEYIASARRRPVPTVKGVIPGITTAGNASRRRRRGTESEAS